MPPGLEPMTFSHTVWATQIAAVADLPDERLDKRLTAILVDTLESPSASIPEAAGAASQATATYRFYDNDRVTDLVAVSPGRHRDRPAVPRPGHPPRRPRHHHTELHRLAHHTRNWSD